MRRVFIPCLFGLVLCTQPYAKQLGKLGDVWAIQEQNLLGLIEDRLKEHFSGKSEQEIKEEVIKRVTENTLRPMPTDLPRAAINSERAFDPSYTVERDLSDHKGRVFAKKGTVVNPFSLYRFNQTLIFIDSDDEAQIKWAKGFKADTNERMIILTKGNLKEAGELLDEQIFFDQYGTLVKRFGIVSVPTVIDELKGKELLRIREFAVQ